MACPPLQRGELVNFLPVTRKQNSSGGSWFLFIFLTLDGGGVGITVSITLPSFHPDLNREELAGAAASSKEEGNNF